MLQEELNAEELQLLHKLHGKKYYVDDFVKLLDEFLHSSTLKPKIDDNSTSDSEQKEKEEESLKQKKKKQQEDNLDHVESFKNAEDEDYDEHDVMIMAKVRKAEEEYITRFINPFFAKIDYKITGKFKVTNSTPVTPEDLLEYHYSTAHGELTHLALEAEILTQQQRFAKHEIHSPSYTDPSHLIRRGYGLESSIFVALLIPPEVISWGLETAMQLQTLKDIIYAEELSWTPSSSPEPFPLFTRTDKQQLWKRLLNKYKPHVTNVPTITIPMCTRTVRSIYNHSRWPIAVRMGMMEYGVHFDESVTGKYKRAQERIASAASTTTIKTTKTTTLNPKANSKTKKGLPEKTFTTELFGYWNPFNDNRAPFILSCMPPEYTSTTSDDSRGFVYKDNIRQRYMDLPPLSTTHHKTPSSSSSLKSESNTTFFKVKHGEQKQNDAHHIAFASRHVARFITLQLYRGESYVLLIEANQIIAPSWDWRLQLLYTRIIFDDVETSLHKYNAEHARTQSTETELENHYESEEEREEEKEEKKNEPYLQKDSEKMQELRAVISSFPVNIKDHVIKCYTEHTHANTSLQAWIEQIQQIQQQEYEPLVNSTSLPHVLRFLHRALEFHNDANQNDTISHTQKLHFNNEVAETVQSLYKLTSSHAHISLTESSLVQMIMNDYDELVQMIEQQLYFNFTYSYIAPQTTSESTTTTTSSFSSSSSTTTTTSTTITTTTTTTESSSSSSNNPKKLLLAQTVFNQAMPINRILYTAGPVRVSPLLNSIDTAELYCAKILKRVLTFFAQNEHADQEENKYFTDTHYGVVNGKHKLPERVALQECWVLFAHHSLHSCVMNKLPIESHVSHLTLQTPWSEITEQIMRFTAIATEEPTHDDKDKNTEDKTKKENNVESDVNPDHHNNQPSHEQQEKEKFELNDKYSTKKKEELNKLEIKWRHDTEKRTSDCLHDMHYFNAPVKEIGTYLHLQCTNEQTDANNNNDDNNDENNDENINRARKDIQGIRLHGKVVAVKNAEGKQGQHIHSINKNAIVTHEKFSNINKNKNDGAAVNADEVNLATSAFLFAPAEAFFDIPEKLQFRHTVHTSPNSKCNTHFTKGTNDKSSEDTPQKEKNKSKVKFTHVTHDPNLSVLTDAEDMFLLTYQLRQSGWHIYKSTEPLSFITSNNDIEERVSNVDKFTASNNNDAEEQNRSGSDNDISSHAVFASTILHDIQMPTSHMQRLRDNTRSRYVQLLKQLYKQK